MIKRTIAAATAVTALFVGGITFAASGGGSPQPIADHDPRSPNYHNPADSDPRSPGYIRTHSPQFQHSPDDEFACGYKFKDLPALGYHPPDYLDDEGAGPAAVVDHDGDGSAGPQQACHVLTRAEVERQRRYIREHGEAPSGEVVE